MNICLICKGHRQAEADAMLSAGQSQARVARALRVDRQVVGRHVRNGHVVRPRNVRQVWEYSDEEMASWRSVLDRLARILADMAGLDLAEVQLHLSVDAPLPPNHPETCRVCDVVEASDALDQGLDALERWLRPPALGRWVEVEAA